ncbi:Vacuolar protein sorting-associated protein 33B [Goodea atripinnis]|uniref:Vacuolar protein sorting-associated protein 33B n=1 Tax=Goodea atripinnis TaxID=208336 RepID=A0ABV0MSZ1_9TELE
MDIQQMKTFVSEELKGLKQEHRLLSLHISASESIMKKKTKQDFQELLKTEHCLLEGFEIRECISFIEEHINRQVSMIESLRLLCLLSVTENGLLPKDFRSLKAQYLQSYGAEHLLTFSNLRQLGLLVEQQPGETLTVMESKVGKLVNDRTAGKLTDAFSSLAKKSNFRALSRKLNLLKSDAQRIILVMFLGGCTFSEISALRFLGKERGKHKMIELIVAVFACRSEVLAAEAVSCLNKALCHLKDIWEEIGIPEDQRLQRTNVVKNHIKVRKLRDIVFRCLTSNSSSSSSDKQEKNIRTEVEALIKEKNQRMQQLKALLEQDQDLCDILCSIPYGIAPDSVPSQEQLENFHQHIGKQNEEKVGTLLFLCSHCPANSGPGSRTDSESFTLKLLFFSMLILQLEERKVENEVTCESHREKIQQLWNRLQVPQEERELFNEHMVTSRRRNLEAVR